ncbi:MAG: type II secretion system protein N [Moraxellaceae bacterium]
MAGMMAVEPLARMAGRLLCVVATVWMAWVLAGVVWLISGHNSARLPAPVESAVRHTAPVVDVSRLAALNLFGQPPLATAKGEAANAPDTSLQLRLTGVFVNADAERSSAIVAERNNSAAAAKVYRVNEGLPGGATLAEVYDDRILIKRGDGASEVLRFEKSGSLLGGDAAAGAGQQVSSGNSGVSDMLSNAVQAMAAAPEEFVQQMGLKPGDNGYEVTAQTPENMRNAVGLQPGDHIVSINGRRLGNPRRDRNVLGELQSGSGKVKVEIQRGGQTVTLERKL